MCHVLTMGKYENITHTHGYILYEDELDHVFEEKDLDVTIDIKLTFEEHVTKLKRRISQYQRKKPHCSLQLE